MVLRFSISAMIYIFDHPSPSHQFPQSQIAGSRTYVGHCAVGWPNAMYICFRNLTKAEVFVQGIRPNPKCFHLWCWFKQSGKSLHYKIISLLPILSKIILIECWLFFNQNSAQATCQVFWILTFGFGWISKMGL